MADKHEEIGLIKAFCPVPGAPCKCPEGNNYQTNCEPAWAHGWRFVVGTEGNDAGWQAHHVLSISCVNWLPNKAAKREPLMRVLKVTKWCINNKDNMLAMPMFGMTIMFYTDVLTKKYYKIGKDFLPPKFENIPQHDFEHNGKLGYCSDVKKDVEKLWDQVAKAEKQHLKSKDGIAGKLNKLSEKWKKELLEERGMRLGGTHKGWKKGLGAADSNWYLPFTMASDDNAEAVYFPCTVRDIADGKIDKIRKSMRAAGMLP